MRNAIWLSVRFGDPSEEPKALAELAAHIAATELRGRTWQRLPELAGVSSEQRDLAGVPVRHIRHYDVLLDAEIHTVDAIAL